MFSRLFFVSAKVINKTSPIAWQSLSFYLIKWTTFFTNMALFTPLWWISFVKREAILLRKGALQKS